MEELRELIEKDIKEREILKEGIRRIKVRQLYLSVIGIIIVLMFFINFLQTGAQIRKENEIIRDLNDVIHAGKLLIESQDETIDSLIVDTTLNYLPKH